MFSADFIAGEGFVVEAEGRDDPFLLGGVSAAPFQAFFVIPVGHGRLSGGPDDEFGRCAPGSADEFLSFRPFLALFFLEGCFQGLDFVIQLLEPDARHDFRGADALGMVFFPSHVRIVLDFRETFHYCPPLDRNSMELARQ